MSCWLEPNATLHAKAFNAAQLQFTGERDYNGFLTVGYPP